MASDRKVLCLLVFLYVAAINAETEKEITEVDEKKIISQEDKPQCVKKFVDWCNKIQYPQEGDQGLAIQSISYRDDANFYRVFCSSDSEGTNCTRNGSPWFSAHQITS
uniref:U7-Saltitoxin-Pre1b_1 n=1 Tax=Phidippus regius TaxID=1905328 RepID=A0A482Z8V5_9ARAC